MLLPELHIPVKCLKVPLTALWLQVEPVYVCIEEPPAPKRHRRPGRHRVHSMHVKPKVVKGHRFSGAPKCLGRELRGAPYTRDKAHQHRDPRATRRSCIPQRAPQLSQTNASAPEDYAIRNAQAPPRSHTRCTHPSSCAWPKGHRWRNYANGHSLRSSGRSRSKADRGSPPPSVGSGPLSPCRQAKRSVRLPWQR